MNMSTSLNTAEVVQQRGIYNLHNSWRGPGSVVGIETGYGLDGPWFRIAVGGEIFRTCPDRPWGPPSLLYNGYRVFSGGKVAGE